MADATDAHARSVSVEQLAAELQGLVDTPGREGRLMLGLCGPPGTGKTTTAVALRDLLGHERAAVVQLDGFHLASNIIAGTELADRRGAIDTFDSGSFATLVERLRTNDEPVIYAPTFERDLEEPINASLAVPSGHDVVIVEGNYLLADGPHWRRVRSCLDEVWYLHTPSEVRVPRLVDRHVRSGKDADDARAWVERSDEANARLIEATRHRADRVVDVAATGRPRTSPASSS